ncbi:MAG: polyketide synthase, partial [Chloroflexi bacterium]
IDSLMMTRLTQRVLVPFKNFSQTFFYEYPTLYALGEALVESYPQECLQWTGLEKRGQSLQEESSTLGTLPAQVSSQATKEPVPYLASLHAGQGSQTSIAIIGISGRYPQAKNLEEYWENLKAGKSCITEIPRARWDWRDHYQNNREEAIASGKSYSKWGAFLDDFDKFDPLFFQMTPREAENIDPQERLFLEECWKALEDAGYSSSSLSPALRQRTGVFGGITKQGFHLYSAETPGQFPSTSFASLVSRVSYYLNLQGPSAVVDTMCSSSLVAIHEACEYIRQGKGDMALAGGVNLYVHPSTYVGLSMSQTISHTEKGVAFGKGGDGFVPGEGVGVIVLKAYDQAVKDGDGIYAVIRGSAVNHNGRTKSYMTPDPGQQAAVIQQALEQNKLDPRTISYIEAAASGSEIVDSIEMMALKRVFGGYQRVKEFYKIGSVKANIGHSEAASGMAQLVKVILSLKHKTLVLTLVPEDFHPTLPFHEWPFQLQREVSTWERLTVDGNEVPRLAGITSVGASGVNAHLIVEEYVPETEPIYCSAHPTMPILFVLSAKNKERLSNYVKQWIIYLEKKAHIDLENIAYTLQIGREEMPCRLAIVNHHQDKLIQQLARWTVDQKNAENCYFSELKVSTDERHLTETSDICSKLAQLWVAGNTVSWNDLHAGKQRVRITGLPTYPFKRRTCWIDRNHMERAAEMIKRGHIPYPQNPEDQRKYNPHRNLNSYKERFLDIKAIKDTLGEIFCAVLKLQPPELEEAETFQDLGIGSINAIQLLEVINSTYNLNLPTSVLFECRNRDTLVEYIKEHLLRSESQQRMPIDQEEYLPIKRGVEAVGTGTGVNPVPTAPALRERGQQTYLKTHDPVISDDIAIIGLSVRCAKAETQDEFWYLISQGKNVIQEITQKSWREFFQLHDSHENRYWHAMMRDVAYFDPLFFKISPSEAEAMEVSQRILLEECYKALEDAGYNPSLLSGQQVATIIGSTGSAPVKSDFSHLALLGSATSILASRIAYFLNLKGPALAIDTACSSSLV